MKKYVKNIILISLLTSEYRSFNNFVILNDSIEWKLFLKIQMAIVTI